MARNLQSIYEYLSEYTKEEINDILYDLSLEDKTLIKNRYGYDLDNPDKTGKFTNSDTKQFYNSLIPRIRRRLNNNRNIDISDLKKQLINLIDSKKFNDAICDTLNINTKTLYRALLELKSEGLMLTRKYYSDGSIAYKKVNTMNSMKELNMSIFSQEKAIITDTKENSIKLLAISDLHFGNKLERLDLIDRAYNYCIKNNINIILSGGDLIDGKYTKGEQSISNTYEQIKYFINNYPHDKNILTFCVGGDHDYSAFATDSFNISEAFDNQRHDIILVGYNNADIKIKNDKIHMYHCIKNCTILKNDAPILLHGHSHSYRTSMVDTTLNVTIPSLSNINQSLPTALEIDIDFNKGYMTKTVIKQIYFGDSDFILSEVEFNLIKGRNITHTAINYIEKYKENKSIQKIKN